MQMDLHAVAVEFQFHGRKPRALGTLLRSVARHGSMKSGNGAGIAPGNARARKREDERGRARYTGHADTISQDTLSKIIIIATHTFERRPH